MLSYKKMAIYLQQQNKYFFAIKPSYIVISIPKIKYHITIYRDQWDEYEDVTGKPYHLFHVSANDTTEKCSSYFWINKHNYHIQKIPKKYFTYNQPSFNFFSSTRSPCGLQEVSPLLKNFQQIINEIV